MKLVIGMGIMVHTITLVGLGEYDFICTYIHIHVHKFTYIRMHIRTYTCMTYAILEYLCIPFFRHTHT